MRKTRGQKNTNKKVRNSIRSSVRQNLVNKNRNCVNKTEKNRTGYAWLERRIFMTVLFGRVRTSSTERSHVNFQIGQNTKYPGNRVINVGKNHKIGLKGVTRTVTLSTRAL